MKQRLLLSLAFNLCMVSMLANGIYYVKDYGAKGDGKTLDHVAINKAIEAATNAGGGQVVLSPGTYLCGSIRLKSNVDLHLMVGAKILAAPAEMKAYDESEVFGAPEPLFSAWTVRPRPVSLPEMWATFPARTAIMKT